MSSFLDQASDKPFGVYNMFDIRKANDNIHFMGKQPAPSLLPILRSGQQAKVLSWLLDDPSREIGVSELAKILDIAQASVWRDIHQAEHAGIVQSRAVGRNRLISARKDSVYFKPLRELLVRAFGPPDRLGKALRDLPGVECAFIYGSWASRFLGIEGTRPVGDIDVLVLGSPNEQDVYEAVSELTGELGYDIQVTFRPKDWLSDGSGSFHDTLLERPMIAVVGDSIQPKNSLAATTAS